MGNMTPYPVPSSPAATATMKANRSVDTGPERRVRSILHRRGYRFRKARRLQLPTTTVRPDIVFGPSMVAVFIDGCFWHGCDEHRAQRPKANATFWRNKIERNRERDVEQTAALREAGWRVLRIWEHVDPTDAADMVEAEVRRAWNARPKRG
jgi:DNA mismatch endonuclease, patch repair protein